MKKKLKRTVVSVATSPDPYISMENHTSNTPLNKNKNKNPLEEINESKTKDNQFQNEKQRIQSKLVFNMNTNDGKNIRELPQVSQTINLQKEELMIEKAKQIYINIAQKTQKDKTKGKLEKKKINSIPIQNQELEFSEDISEIKSRKKNITKSIASAIKNDEIARKIKKQILSARKLPLNSQTNNSLNLNLRANPKITIKESDLIKLEVPYYLKSASTSNLKKLRPSFEEFAFNGSQKSFERGFYSKPLTSQLLCKYNHTVRENYKTKLTFKSSVELNCVKNKLPLLSDEMEKFKSVTNMKSKRWDGFQTNLKTRFPKFVERKNFNLFDSSSKFISQMAFKYFSRQNYISNIIIEFYKLSKNVNQNSFNLEDAINFAQNGSIVLEKLNRFLAPLNEKIPFIKNNLYRIFGFDNLQIIFEKYIWIYIMLIDTKSEPNIGLYNWFISQFFYPLKYLPKLQLEEIISSIIKNSNDEEMKLKDYVLNILQLSIFFTSTNNEEQVKIIKLLEILRKRYDLLIPLIKLLLN